MSYRFTMSKSRDTKNKFDICDVEVRLEENDLDATEVIVGFKNFLRACGFSEVTINKYLSEEVE